MPKPLTPIDPRIAEAMQAIGTIVENDDLDHADFEPIAIALEQMARITRNIALARAYRLAGRIELAVRFENANERLIGSMPEGALWS